MLSFLFFGESFSHTYTCGHGSLPPTKIKPRKKVLSNNPMTYKEEDREKIEIEIDFAYSKGTDSYMCKDGKKSFSWAYGTTNCQEKDFLTSKQITALDKTIKNVRYWLESAIKINKYNEKILLKDGDDYHIPLPDSKKSSYGDIYITVVARPINATCASQTFSYNYADYRPEQGLIIVNPSEVPLLAQNVDDHERAYFLILLHEFIHVLGMNQDTMHDKWIERRMAYPYKPTPIENVTTSDDVNRSAHVLMTNVAKQYAMRRWNLSDYGIELENSAKPGYADTHLESRVFMSELMAPEINEYAYISDATFALLEDMGWYSCNYSYAEQLPYGSAVANNNGTYFTNFTNSIPHKVFPSNYLRPEDAGGESCSYDYRAKARVAADKIPFNCTEEQNSNEGKIYCANEKFYDTGKNGSIADSGSTYDFQYIPIPYELCPEKEYCGIQTKDGEKTAICLPFAISNGAGTSFSLNGKTYTCNKENIAIIDENEVISCPNQTIIASIEKFRQEKVQPFDLEPLPGDSEVYTYYVISIIVICVVVVLIIVIVVIYFCCCKKDKDEPVFREITEDGVRKRQKRRRIRKRVPKKKKEELEDGIESADEYKNSDDSYGDSYDDE